MIINNITIKGNHSILGITIPYSFSTAALDSMFYTLSSSKFKFFRSLVFFIPFILKSYSALL